MDIHSFSLEFRKQIQNRKSGFNTRELLIVQLFSDGLNGYGEIAPLPGYSGESLSQAREQYVGISQHLDIKDLIQQEPTGIIENILKLSLYPSVECGLLSALLDLKAQTESLPVHRLLRMRPVKSLRCNALISFENSENTFDLVSAASKRGYTCIKLKFGRPEFESDLEVLRTAVEVAGQDILFRLDVNGGWRYTEARHHLNKLADYPIDYIEQPLPAGRLDELTQLQTDTPIPIALDESIQHITAWDEFFQQSPVNILVLKPMIHGLFFLSPDFQNLLNKYNSRLIISSSFESPVGHAFLCQLAAAVAPFETHGLATLDVFKNIPEIQGDYSLTKGHIRLPDNDGLGSGLLW